MYAFSSKTLLIFARFTNVMRGEADLKAEIIPSNLFFTLLRLFAILWLGVIQFSCPDLSIEWSSFAIVQ